MAKEEEEETKLHIAMFPWLAFGHITPFLHLSKFIAQKGHRISFISTPRNIDRLPKLPPSLSPLINFVKIPLPRTEDIPEDAQATIDLPRDKVPHLKNAYDGLQDSIVNFLQSSKPDWIIYDFTARWLPHLARDSGIPNAFFCIFGAACLSFMGPTLTPDDRQKPEDYTVSPYWVPFATKVSFRLFEVLKVYDDSSVPRRFRQVLEGCDVVAVRSCFEFEREWLNLLQDMHRKPVFPIGSLLTKPCDANREDRKETWMLIKEWFSKQATASVLYVAFGTEAVLTQDELTEIALGLELSGLPFLWVLRILIIENDSIKLPDGFEERTKGRGFVWTSWAPQVDILGDESVGGFLTHAGWGSLMEGLQFGRPLVALTFSNDQGLNAKLLEEKMVGISVPRDEVDGSFTRESLADSVKLILAKEEGKIYRDKAKEMKLELGDDNKQDKYLDKFLAHLINHRRIKEI